MIYLIDQSEQYGNHSMKMRAILNDLTSEVVEYIPIPSTLTDKRVVNVIAELVGKVNSSDIVLTPWLVPTNVTLVTLFEQLSDKCWVVVPAGNTAEPIDQFTPAGIDSVITVGALNKSGNRAGFSNYSTTKPLVWVTGTNYEHKDFTETGTCVSATVYAALLANALIAGDPRLVDQYIDQYTVKTALQLQG